MSERFNLSDYVPVQERIGQFWADHPDGAILTRLMSPPDDFGQCRYEATVYKHRDDARASATGYAFETAGGRGPNSTSHEENCETSCIGRALANMGYATSLQNRASREEMEKVARGPQVPARTRTTSENTVPAVIREPTRRITRDDDRDTAGYGDPGEIVSWSAFWTYVEAAGYPRDKSALEKQMGTTIGANPAYALERFEAWRKDVAEAEQGVLV